jgi:hypothetical protein
VRISVLAWELIGIVLITLVGSFLHFLFDLSGGLLPVALIAAVNESVWEHLKIGFWPAFVYALVEFRFIKKETKNFWLAKTIGISLIPILITVLFYGYTAILREDLFVLDITIFIVAIIVGQLVSYKLLTGPEYSAIPQLVPLVVLIVLVVAFSTLTYFPPHLPLFQDPISGGYGIV